LPLGHISNTHFNDHCITNVDYVSSFIAISVIITPLYVHPVSRV
jgi:hypothetical protein